MTLEAAINDIFAAFPNKYRRERWRHARGKLGVEAMINICKAEGYDVIITARQNIIVTD